MPSGTTKSLAMRIGITKMMGDEPLIQGTLDGQQIRVLMPYSAQIREGEAVNLRLRYDRLKLFDEAFGLAIRPTGAAALT